MSVYDYSVTTPAGEEISLKNYEGKVLLIVYSALQGAGSHVRGGS